ncbi:hypothetical protein Val02_66530 [Virgisporangium aliadipatigenens]|uniref:Uncharacterized protein n=1 Tax=Virgisporangium aliadipatigenens TaxID=741659 RepID=A0A8J4DV38_9ACTN|nr:hypothetical protein Val02_66530 [Virgisporangium aliadipatigenens]
MTVPPPRRHRFALTHAKRLHRPGPVCGADDATPARLSGDPPLGSCVDCLGLAEWEALPDDATA